MLVGLLILIKSKYCLFKLNSKITNDLTYLMDTINVSNNTANYRLKGTDYRNYAEQQIERINQRKLYSLVELANDLLRILQLLVASEFGYFC